MRRLSPTIAPALGALPLVALLTACSSTSRAAPEQVTTASDAVAAATAAATPFLPAGYQGELFVDWAAIRDIGLLDRLQRLPMGEEMLEVLAHDYCCQLDDLACVRTAFSTAEHRERTVSVAQLVDGAVRRPAPKDWSEAQLGPHGAFRYGTGPTARVAFWPEQHLAVNGSAELLRDIVAGTQPTGGPHPELAAVLAGDGVLAQIAYGRFDHPYDEVLRTFGKWFGDEHDPVDFVRLRLGQDLDGGLVLSVTLRFENGTTGLRGTEQLVRGKIDELLDDKQLAPFKPIFGAVVVAHRDKDLTGSLLLGTPKQAVATLERAAIAMTARMQSEQRR